MDLYQIFITHNRAWTVREILAFSVSLAAAAGIAAYLLRRRKIAFSQAAAGIGLLVFLAVVFGSTVFTRNPGERQYQLEVFWSWKEILGIGEGGRPGSISGNGLLIENILNMILLSPAGFLLPFVFGKGLRWWQGLSAGVVISGAIELLQLALCRGLFEFDDIIHNSVGCMAGCLLGSCVLKKIEAGGRL